MTPDQFQAAATAWITAITIVGVAALGATVTIMTQVSKLKQAQKDMATRVDDHSKRMTATDATVARIALATEPTKNNQVT